MVATYTYTLNKLLAETEGSTHTFLKHNSERNCIQNSSKHVDPCVNYVRSLCILSSECSIVLLENCQNSFATYMRKYQMLLGHGSHMHHLGSTSNDFKTRQSWFDHLAQSLSEVLVAFWTL